MARRLFAKDDKAKEISKRLESHSFTNEEGEEYTESAFGGFGDYFRRKKVKLQNRDAELRTAYSSSDVPKVFRGCVLCIQGYTNPNSTILRQLIVKHGGVYLDYAGGKATVTHVIATNLPPKKRVEFANYKVVKPDWILDSIEQGKLLEWTRYRIINEKAGQARLGIGSGGPALVKTETPSKSTYKTPMSVAKTTRAVELVRLPTSFSDEFEIPASEGYDDEEDSPPPGHQSESQLLDEVSYNDDGPPPSYQPRKVFDLPLSQMSANEEPLEAVDLVAGPSTRHVLHQVGVEKQSFVSNAPAISFQEPILPNPQEAAEVTSEHPLPATGVTTIDGVEAYEAEAVLDEKKHPAGAKPKNKKGKRKFLVKWKGYPEDEATWEWEDNLREDLDDDVLDEMILEYRRANGLPENPEPTQRSIGKRRRKSAASNKGSCSTNSSTRSTTEDRTTFQAEVDDQDSARVLVRDFATKEAVALPRPSVSFVLPESISTINLSPDMVDDNETRYSPVPTEPDTPSAQQPHGSTSMEDEPPSSLPTPPMIDDPTPSMIDDPPPLDRFPIEDEIPNSFPSVHLSQISNWETVNEETAPPAATPPPRPAAPVQAPATPSQTPVKKRPLPEEFSDFKTPQKKVKAIERSSPSPMRTVGRKPQTAEEFNTVLLANPRVRDATVLNPNFLTKFFQESRLHHLSTWKAELQARMQALAQSSSPLAPAKPRQRRYVMHVDFDCFFAAVSIRDRPELKDKPVAICHGNSTNSTSSEIASCNYVARGFGIKNGSWMASARQLCPDLVCLGYEFGKYEEASEAFYKAILSVGGERIQAVSVDEALVDISNRICDGALSDINGGELRAAAIATEVRDMCRERTGCEVSVGIGQNILMAKLALRKAKPAGQHIVHSTEVESFLDSLSISSFPGIGSHISSKVSEKYHVNEVRDVCKISKEQLRQTLGPKTGDRLYELCRGIDHTQVGGEGDTPRQSVSVDVNWGVRFTEQSQAETFVMQLCEELERRMVAERVMGRNLTVKVAQRAKGVPFETTKFLGCGRVETVNKSFAFKIPTREAKVVGRKVVEILRSCKISPGELRGTGVSFKGLERDNVNTGGQRTLKFAEAKQKPQQLQLQEREQVPAQPMKVTAYVKPPVTTLIDVFAKKVAAKKEREPPRPSPATQFDVPSASQIDPSVLEVLPTPVKRQTKGSTSKAPPVPVKSAEQAKAKLVPSKAPEVFQKPIPPPPKVPQESPAAPRFAATQFDLPSPSQIDPSVLTALPSPIRESILAQQRAKAPPSPASASALEQPPSSQFDIRTWNDLPQSFRDAYRAEYEESRRLPPQPEPPPPKNRKTVLQQSPSKNRQTLLPQSPRKNRVLPRPSNLAKKIRKPVEAPVKIRRKVFDPHGNDVSEWLFTEAGVDEATFFVLDNVTRLQVVHHYQKEREKRLEAETKVRNLERQRRVRLETALRIPVKRRRPVWVNSSLDVPLISTDTEGVKAGIRKWARPAKDRDAEEADDEGPHPADLEEWCGFLSEVVTVEKRLDKAAMYVRAFLFEAGERFGWGTVCEHSVNAVNDAARREGKSEVEF